MKKNKYNYVFGPVPSRRLGMSLGINPIPLKTCNYSCVYCQLGRTNPLTNDLKEYISSELIKKELFDFFSSYRGNIDYITIVGEGEPLLNSKIGEIVDFVKKNFKFPLALITNGALFYVKEIRKDVSKVDVILPTVDTVFEETFKIINRPSPKLPGLSEILEGMLKLRDEFSGQIWVEVMLVKDINDNEKEIKGLSQFFEKFKPDRIYVNVPVRPPAENYAKPPSPYVFSIVEKFMPTAIILNYSETGKIDPSNYSSLEELIISISRRHPISVEMLKDSIDVSFKMIEETVKRLKDLKKIELIEFENKTFIRGKK